MLLTAFRSLSVPINLLKSSFLSQSLTLTRGRKLWMRPYLVSLYKRRLDQGPEPDRHRSVWLNWNYDSEIYSFGKRLGEEFKMDTLKRAFIMSSYIEKQKNERLQLGVTDDVAHVDLADNSQLAQTGELAAKNYIEFFLKSYVPHFPSDGVSAVANYLLSTDTLVHIASNLGVNDLVHTEEFPVSPSSLSAVFKAIIGALHHDQGKERADLFVQDFVLTQLIGRDIFEIWTVGNPMGLLLETLRSQGRSDPEPRLLWSTGSETILSSYIVGIYVDRQLVGKAPGETVSIAEEMAAKDALRRLWNFDPNHRQLPFDRRVQKSDGNDSKLRSNATVR